MLAHIEILPLDWDPEAEMGEGWRSTGGNLRETQATGQTRSVEMSWDIKTGAVVAKIGKRNPMGKISRPRYYAISAQQIAQILLDYDKAQTVKL
jgi:hypothetical protein